LSQGDYLIVKKRLNAGEARRLMSRMVLDMTAGEKVRLNPEQVGRSKAVEYLLDWSFVDGQGNPVVIRDKNPEDLGRVLDGLNQESYKEVIDAIDAHETAMEAERDVTKNAQATSNASSAISTSAE
jgi:hypothetical protein